jgi:hypothetical protein
MKVRSLGFECLRINGLGRLRVGGLGKFIGARREK